MHADYNLSDPLAVIYNESYWRICKVSPMYNFKYSKIKLKQYATKICQALVNDTNPSLCSRFNVLLENQPMLKYRQEDFDGLRITVNSRSTVNSRINTKVIYVAIVLSWGISSRIENSVHLPYMLEHGDQKVGTAVKNTMQKIFDCNIKQYNFTQLDLLRFGFKFIENDTSRHSDPFVLCFKTPQVNIKDQLTLTFEVGDIHIIWNSIKDEGGDDDSLVTRAFTVLQRQIHHMTTIDVIVYDLWRVLLPKAEIKNSGVVRMKTPEIINSVFTVLNEITPFYPNVN